MKRDKEYLEKFYSTPDPWGYQKNKDDIKRKKIILKKIDGKFKRALDIGCGEGWITKDLPADMIYGYEISDNACKRFPKNVKRILEPKGKYDLIIATGVLYEHYDYEFFHKMIEKHASGIVLTCNLLLEEMPLNKKPIFKTQFLYRERIEQLRVYDYSSPQHRRKNK